MTDLSALDAVIEKSLRRFSGRVCTLCGKSRPPFTGDYCEHCMYKISEGFVTFKDEDNNVERN